MVDRLRPAQVNRTGTPGDAESTVPVLGSIDNLLMADSLLDRPGASRRRVRHDCIRGDLLAFENGFYAALAEHRHAIAHAYDFRQLRRDHDDCVAPPGELAHQQIDFR